jgi:hypothetical protein
VPGSLAANNGGAVFIFNSFGPRVRTDAGWQEVKTIFININSEWQQTEGLYINENSVWLPVVGIFVPTFESQADDWARVSRPPDRRALPPPPPVVYDSVRQTGCFIAGTQITMADGSTKSIEDVVIGDQVIGRDGAINTVQEYIRPLLGDRTLVGFNGGLPFITNDHPVLTTDGTWRSVDPSGTASKYAAANLNAEQLSVKDTIVTGNGTGFEIVSIEEHADSADLQVYNFSLDGNNTYIANGLVVHNKNTGFGRGGAGSAGSSGGNGSGASTAGGSSPGSAYSDARLKQNIKLIDTLDDGLKIYSFNYAWSDIQWVGVIAQDLLEHTQFSHAVKLESNGFYSVDYSKINFEMITADQYRCLHRET